MAPDQPASQDGWVIEADYHGGAIVVPPDVRGVWDARGVTRVRITADAPGEHDDAAVHAIMRVQHAEREVVAAMLAAAGSLAGGGFAERALGQPGRAA